MPASRRISHGLRHQPGRHDPRIRDDERPGEAELAGQLPEALERAFAEHHPGSQVKVERPHVVCSLLYAARNVYLRGGRGRRRNDAHRGAGRADAGQTCELRPLLADLARSREHRHLGDGQSAHRVERDQEPAVEGRNSRARSLVADRLGRSGLRHHGGAGRRDRRGAARPARLAAAARRPPLRRHGPRSEDRARRSGSTSRAKPSRTSSRTSTTARGRRARPSPTASGSTPTSSRSGSTPTT